MEELLINYNALNEVSIFDQLESRLLLQKEEDILTSQDISKLNANYELYNEKLNLSRNIANKDITTGQKYLENILKIDCLTMDKGKKLRTMLSYGVMANNFSKINDLSSEEIQVLAYSCTKESVGKMEVYLQILSDREVIQNIVCDTTDIDEQANLVWCVMEEIDYRHGSENIDYSFTNSEDYFEFVNLALETIQDAKEYYSSLKY